MKTSNTLFQDYLSNTSGTRAQMIINHNYKLTLHEISCIRFTSDQQIPKTSEKS